MTGKEPAMRVPGLLDELKFGQVAERYSLINIQQELLAASVRVETLWRSRVPTPNPLDTKEYLNRYSFRPNRPLVVRLGRPELTTLEFVLNSIDFTFVRHIAAPYYKMRNEQPIHDPPNLYLIHLWIIASDLWHEEAIELLGHKRLGREARELLSLKLEEVPKTYTVLTRFLERLGDEGLFAVSRAFFWILAQANIFTGPVHIAGDSQLVATFSRYRGCNSFQPSCAELPVKREEVKAALLQTVEKCAKIWSPTQAQVQPAPNQRFAVCLPCPFGATSGKDKRALDVRIGWMRLFDKTAPGAPQDEAPLWGLQSDFLSIHNLGVRLENSRLVDAGMGEYRLSCPHFPSDPSARIGWKNSNQPNGKPVPVFGADIESLTFLIPELGLELPFGARGAPGNSPSRLGELLTLLNDTGDRVRPLSASLDARYDTRSTYELLRSRLIPPIIDLVHHKNEDSPEATAKRGIRTDGVPLALCGEPMKPNGFDAKEKRRTFLCGHQKSPEICGACPFGPQHAPNGQVIKVSVKQWPRYVIEIPRGSPSWKQAYARRTASERTNADVALLVPKAIVKNRLRGVDKIAAKAVLALHFLLWTRISTFVSAVGHLNDLTGGLPEPIEEAARLDNAATFHQIPDSHVLSLMSAQFG